MQTSTPETQKPAQSVVFRRDLVQIGMHKWCKFEKLPLKTNGISDLVEEMHAQNAYANRAMARVVGTETTMRKSGARV
jgi:hypothetical protein